MEKIKNPPTPRLARPKRESHPFNTHFPIPLWARIVKRLAYGEVTQFIIDAVTRELDRLDQEEAKK